MQSTSTDPHHFDFDLDRGIREQVVRKLESSPLLPLTKSCGPQSSGIYALYRKGELVYIGKASKGTTKSKRTLRGRLAEHCSKIGGRRNIKLSEMSCRYLTFASEWWVFAAEFALMSHYQPEWNDSGFGSKVPGVGRPGTNRVSRWNAQFPPRSPGPLTFLAASSRIVCVRISKEKRSRMMAAVRATGNRDTELKLASILRRHRISGWRRHLNIPGKPDFVFATARLAVFVDGCFWHGCRHHCRMPKRRLGFWATKIAGNKRRDVVVNRLLRKGGWRVFRVWEHALRDPDRVATKIQAVLASGVNPS